MLNIPYFILFRICLRTVSGKAVKRDSGSAALRTSAGVPDSCPSPSERPDSADVRSSPTPRRPATVSGCGVTGRRSRNERKRQKKSVRKKIQESRGGVQPLLPDCNPPAGRELSEKEGHGDQPGDGRGGDTGAKKSRGAASALPAVPLPDVVSGRLGAGADLTSSVSSSSGAAERRPVSSPVSAVREPRGFRRVMPARLRLEQRRLTESESVENKGTGI